MGDGFSQFPIGLTIELVRLNEDAATVLSCLEEDKVSRHSLSLSDLDDMATFDVFRLNGNDCT